MYDNVFPQLKPIDISGDTTCQRATVVYLTEAMELLIRLAWHKAFGWKRIEEIVVLFEKAVVYKLGRLFGCADATTRAVAQADNLQQ